MSYIEPIWILNFKKKRIDLLELTDAKLNALWDDTSKCHANNMTTYKLALTVHGRLLRDAIALYGEDHPVVKVIRKNAPEQPSLEPFRKMFRKLCDAAAEARKDTIRRNKQRENGKRYRERKRREWEDQVDAAVLEGASECDLYALEPTEIAKTA